MLRYLLAFGLIPLLATQAQARMQDMFDNRGFVDINRPYVVGDRSRHADFFGEPQPYVSTNKDMFDHVHSAPSGTDMFTQRRTVTPYGRLYDWPRAAQ